VNAGPSRALAQAMLTVDLGVLQDNWRLLRRMAAPARCAAVVKADAYGVGLERAVSALAEAGCDAFFVAHLDEALRARKVLAATPAASRIYLLNGFASQKSAAEACVGADVVPMIGTDEDAILWREQAARAQRPLPIALMFDTGMNRLGFDWTRADEIARRLSNEPALEIALVCSHFISSDRPTDAHNPQQIAWFDKVRSAFPGTPASLANSSGIFLPQRPVLDLVRPGYALYGGNPTPGYFNSMRPVVGLRARILQVREVETGECVGYDAQWTARRRSRLAAVGVGYADGLPRNSMSTDSKIGGEAMVGGVRCPFAGRVSMDLTMIDVTEAPPTLVAPGEWVELLGSNITIDDLGARAQTIGYEILTNLGRRYFRDYVQAPEAPHCE
jgi:alanine racemase